MMRRWIVRDLLPGYAQYFVVLLLMLTVLPWQVRLLGEAWPALAFCLALHALLFGLDLALAPLMLTTIGAVPAEARRRVHRGHMRRAAALALGMLAVTAILLLLLSVAGMPVPADPASLVLAALLFVVQSANAATVAFWQGLGQHARAAGRNTTFLLLRQALACLALVQVAPTAPVFLAAWLVGSLAEWFLNVRLVGREHQSDAEAPEYRPPGGEHRPALASALLALLIVHADRLWFAFAVDGQQFGIYALLVTPLLSYLSLQVPVQRTLLPHLADPANGPRTLRRMFGAHALLALPLVLAAPVTGTLVSLWLGPGHPAQAASALWSGLFVAFAAGIALAPVNAWWFAHRQWRRLIGLQMVVVVVQWLLFTLLTPRWGLGAGIAAASASPFVLAVSILVDPGVRRTFTASSGGR